jgi:transglutaminase-like putative cysteine protease
MLALWSLLGLEVRRHVGCFAGYPDGRGALREAGMDSLLAHSWGSVLIPGRGWLPMDSRGFACGENAMTPRNVCSPGFAERVRARSTAWRRYYFGNLDCTRVEFSPSALELPVVQPISLQAPSARVKFWNSSAFEPLA